MTFRYRYRKQILFCLCLIILIAAIVFYFINNDSDDKEIKKETKLITKKKQKKETKQVEQKEIMVDVKGEVVNKGIYKLKVGSRVIDAIEMAGGITEKGDTSVLNLSKKLTDEMVIIVYSFYEVEHFKETKEEENIIQNNCINGIDGINNNACIDDNSTTTNNKLVSINTASKDELKNIPGIGDEKAKSIIEYRNNNGNFKTIEDIKNVSGIGDSIFEKIKDYITV